MDIGQTGFAKLQLVSYDSLLSKAVYKNHDRLSRRVRLGLSSGTVRTTGKDFTLTAARLGQE